MLYKKNYQSPLGILEIVCDEISVKGIWTENQKYYGSHFDLNSINAVDNKVIKQVENWLDSYFKGNNPSLEQINLQPEVTEYRKKVLDILVEIPLGETMSYKEIALQLNDKYPENKTSARAVGGAVGHNPISILIPCHRVVGSDNSLTGFAGGLSRKIELLTLEGFDRKTLETGYLRKK